MGTFDAILVAFEPGDAGLDALSLGLVLGEATGATVTVAKVASKQPAAAFSDEAIPEALRSASRRLGTAVAYRTLIGRSPAAALKAFAEAGTVDLIVVGPSARAGLVPGSVADQLMPGAPCAIAAAPQDFHAGYLLAIGAGSQNGASTPLVRETPRVLEVAFDDSAESRAALQLAVRLGLQTGATLRVVSVLPRLAGDVVLDLESARNRYDFLHEQVADLPHELRALPISETGDAVSRLCARAEEGVDLIIVGSRRRGPLRRVVLGSVATGLMRYASCPVLVAPRPSAEDARLE